MLRVTILLDKLLCLGGVLSSLSLDLGLNTTQMKKKQSQNCMFFLDNAMIEREIQTSDLVSTYANLSQERILELI